jgi:RNA polymerase sigma factor (sigma-70 family)
MEQPPKDSEEPGPKDSAETDPKDSAQTAPKDSAEAGPKDSAQAAPKGPEETVEETVEEQALKAALATDYRLRLMIEKVVHRRAIAEEILQEAHIRLLAQEPAKILNPVAWVRKVAVRLALNYLRHKNRNVELEDEYPDFSEVPDFSDAPQQKAQRAELDAQLAKAIRGLLPEQVELVRLHYFKGLPLKEIARRWNITEGAVAHRVTRILIQCRQRLKKAGIDASELD